MLKIELSLPKLVYGNNFDELQYKDFKQVAEKLAVVLETMGVNVSVETLANAPVAAIHYSKNIPLRGGNIPYQYIQKIKEANIKRIVENDSALQLKLIKKFEQRNKLEILRMEVRLNKRVKMKQLLSKLGVKTDLSFKKLFKPAIAKKVLLHYIDELESRRSSLLDYTPSTDKGLLAALILNNPDLSPNKIMQLFGLKKAFEVATTRELRVMLARHGERAWYRLMTDAKNVKLPEQSSYFSDIRRCIELFKPTKLAGF